MQIVIEIKCESIVSKKIKQKNSKKKITFRIKYFNMKHLK
jgi:hypothetical protein